MNEYISNIPVKFIVPLNVNGMSGRMLRLPAKGTKSRDILLVYDMPGSLEQIHQVAILLNKYGSVTVPDLPGVGGMDSFYKIGQKPTINNFADYLAAIVKLRYKRRRLTVVGWGFGFVALTRMLQNHPEIASRVDLVVSVEGFTHHEDLVMSKSHKALLAMLTEIFSTRVTAPLIRQLAFRPKILKKYYQKNLGHDFNNLNVVEKSSLAEVEAKQLRAASTRTYLYSVLQQLKLDNCRVQIDLPVWHISRAGGKKFNRHAHEQHMRVTYNDFIRLSVKSSQPSTVLMSNQKELTKLLPVKLRTQLNKKLRA